ncbi:MAG: hypothetical protein ACOX5J_17295 [Candidatus Hydrogenedentales bacterium]|jgi:hypothetical protein
MMCKRSYGILLLAVALAAALSGCATGKAPVSDEASIRETLAVLKAGLEGHNLDLILSVVSEEFVSDEGGSKTDFREYVAQLIDDGILSGAKMNLETARVTIEKDMATAENVALSGDRGAAQLDMDLKRESGGAWRIVGLQAF